MSIRPFRNITPTLGKRVFIDDSAVVIGRVTLGDDVSVWPTTVIRGDVNTINIGARTNVQDGSVLHVNSPKPELPNGLPLVIGTDVTVGHRCVLHGCTIGNFCLIGMGAIVLDGAVLEDYVFIGAGAMVSLGHVVLLNPRQFDALYELGNMMEDYGNKAGALKLYRKALELDPQLGGARKHVDALTRDVEGQGI